MFHHFAVKYHVGWHPFSEAVHDFPVHFWREVIALGPKTSIATTLVHSKSLDSAIYQTTFMAFQFPVRMGTALISHQFSNNSR